MSEPEASLPEPGNLNLAWPLFRHSVECGENAALVLDEKVFSYSELASLAARVAGWIGASAPAAAGETRVAIVASRSLEAYAGILGACWAGAAYVPINPKLPAQTLRQILEVAQPRAIIVDAAGGKRLEESGAIGDVPVPPPGRRGGVGGIGEVSGLPAGSLGGASVLDGISAVERPVAFPGERVAYVIFASG